MAELTPATVSDVLAGLHAQLDVHFAALKTARASLTDPAPVYALEHGLSSVDLDALGVAVRHVVAAGFGYRWWRESWLPFAVYAAESGYDYEGNEFWQSFEASTPGWAVHGNRDRIRYWFMRFAVDYGGALPEGAFARNFPIIAWPITHAVLPVYLQRYLAQLLYEFRMGLTTELLQEPEELGRQLAARAWDTTERFRIFCQNTSLLGQLAVALLSGEGEDSPYLLPSTLHRLVEGMEKERQAKFWLQSARHSATQARTRGFFAPSPPKTGSPVRSRLPNPTDPRLLLRAGEAGWRVFALMPDLRSLSRRLPHVFEELRTKRARVEGADQTMLAPGRLTSLGQEVRLTRWPTLSIPFVQIEDGDPAVNSLIRDQVQVARGPFWLFKRRDGGNAVEIKSKVAHPGESYVVVYQEPWLQPGVPWLQASNLDATGAQAVRMDVPNPISEEESAALVAAGISVATDVFVRPVGFPASAWDGEGSVEWLVGEPGIVGVHVQEVPADYTLTLDSLRYTRPWPAGELDLYLCMEDMAIGAHELIVELTSAQDRAISSGSLVVTVRDPQVQSEGAEVGEGIRLLASPSRPTMSELWAPEAITVAGPEGLKADLSATLRSATDKIIGKVQQQVTLPLLEKDWAGVAKKIRGDDRFTRNFDQAESVEISVSRSGVGYAQLKADRGFQPLRWTLTRDRDTNKARLIDRTDSGSTRVELYRVEHPTAAISCEADADVEIPATGGLLRAIATQGIDSEAIVLLPTRPTELFGKVVVPEVYAGSRDLEGLGRLAKAYQWWANADLPGDFFAQRQRDEVLEAITRSLVSNVAGARWGAVERDAARARDPLDIIDDMQKAVGESEDQKQLARTIGLNLYAWLDPAALLVGFATTIAGTLLSSGITSHDSAPRFLLTLAGRSGQIMQWPDDESRFLLKQALDTPLLLRAARFAVLGTRYLKASEEAERGF